MKTPLIALALVAALWSCDNKKVAQLEKKVDSLNVQLVSSREVEESMNEVGALIDSIDASRSELRIKMIEGSSYADYVARLREINNYVQRTEAKLDALENSAKKSSKSSASAIKRLKADLKKTSDELLELQSQLANMREENLRLWTKVNEKDSMLSIQDQVIKMKEGDVASLERLVNDTNAANKLAVADLYYAQAAALETVANRTQFAPRKKKQARREALELYRLSLSLGKVEAQSKIDGLEKELS
jgi:chromosome segregation ATPase